jgi:hypothetical protein
VASQPTEQGVPVEKPKKEVSSEVLRYWESRKHLLYNLAVQSLAAELGKTARSALDVGSWGCPSLEWLPNVPRRVSVDIDVPYSSPTVEGIKTDFFTWTPKERFDLVMCLQVLEHIERADAFAQKLLAVGDTVIVSVPYKWKPGRVRGHVQDPVDEAKLRSWFRREPNFSFVCREITTDAHRLVVVYEPGDLKWKDLRERRSLLNNPAPQSASGQLK